MAAGQLWACWEQAAVSCLLSRSCSSGAAPELPALSLGCRYAWSCARLVLPSARAEGLWSSGMQPAQESADAWRRHFGREHSQPSSFWLGFGCSFGGSCDFLLPWILLTLHTAQAERDRSCCRPGSLLSSRTGLLGLWFLAISAPKTSELHKKMEPRQPWGGSEEAPAQPLLVLGTSRRT